MGRPPPQIAIEEQTVEHLHDDDDYDDDDDDDDEDEDDEDDQDDHLSVRERVQIECFAQEPSQRSENVHHSNYLQDLQRRSLFAKNYNLI